MQIDTSYKVTDLSPHLFWDAPQEKHDWERNAKIIVKRVLDFGLDNDWKILKSVYGLQRIYSIAKLIPDLTDISANYLSVICEGNIEEFECYKRRLLTPHFSGY